MESLVPAVPTATLRGAGQDHVALALRNAVRQDKVAHAYLFSGPRGTGKTTSARILAKALNCENLSEGEPCGRCASCEAITRGASFDVHELDAASNNGVDAMRDLVARAALSTPGRWKVYIVDEVHMLSTAASNALLKTLEEPPPHVVFVLATTDPQKVLPTIRSRTQHFEFHLIPAERLEALLTEVATRGGLDLPSGAVQIAVRRGRGSARDALSVLDQVAAAGLADDSSSAIAELIAALADRDTGRALAAIARGLADGRDVHRLSVELVEGLRRGFLLLAAPATAAQLDGTLGDAEGAEVEVRGLGLARCVRAMEVIGATQVDMRASADPRITLEVALVRLTHPEADDSSGAILERLERLERTISKLSSPPAGPGSTGSPAPQAERTPQPPEPATATMPSGSRPALGAFMQRSQRPLESSADAGSATSAEDAGRPVAGQDGDEAGNTRETGNTDKTGHNDETGNTGNHASDQPAGRSPEGVGGSVHLAQRQARAHSQGQDPKPTASTDDRPDETTVVKNDRPLPTCDDLVAAWGDHILVSLRPKARALFQTGRFLAMEDDVAVLALPNEAHKSHAQPHSGEIAATLSSAFGRDIRLRLVVDGGATGSDSTRRPSAGDPKGDAGLDDIGNLDDFDYSEPAPHVRAGGPAVSWAADRLLEAFPGTEEVEGA